jgi:Kef-type K+ transport system membrane component KefB
MPEVAFDNLLIVLVVALLAPLLLGLAPRLKVPAVVLEIVAGIVVGPSGLGWVEADLVVQVVAVLGLAFLLFLAGLEIDVHRLRGRLLTLALLGYAVSLLLGLSIGFGVSAADWVDSPLLFSICLSATSLGLVVAVLKDVGQVDGAVGQTTIAAASVADFAAVLALSLLFSGEGGGGGSRVILLVLFALVVLAVGLVVTASARSVRLGSVFVRLQDTTAEIRIRAAMVLLVVMVVLAEHFGLESILGAFMAGALVGLLDRDSATHPHFRVKLEAIGYGFLIPVFFVTSGVRLDVTGLVEDPAALARVPVFLAALLVVRGVPALLFRRDLGGRATATVGLLQATSLPFIVTATMIGVETGLMSPVTAAALVCAGLLSVLLFPALAVSTLSRSGPDETVRRTAPEGRPAAPRSASPR